jgi:hypothetical protein
MKRLIKSELFIMFFFSLSLPNSLLAQTVSESSAHCSTVFEQCQAQCKTDYKDDNVRRAPCMTVCSGKYAACDAGVVYDTAKPWVDEKIEQSKPWFEEQADKAKKLFDDLMKDYNSDTDQPNSQEKTKDNSI